MLKFMGVFLIVLGLLSIFAKDFIWEQKKKANSAEGLVSERTPSWETSSTISGILVIIAGFICLVA